MAGIRQRKLTQRTLINVIQRTIVLNIDAMNGTYSNDRKFNVDDFTLTTAWPTLYSRLTYKYIIMIVMSRIIDFLMQLDNIISPLGTVTVVYLLYYFLCKRSFADVFFSRTAKPDFDLFTLLHGINFRSQRANATMSIASRR